MTVVASRARQTAVGLTLAASVIGAWLGLHVWAVFVGRWSWSGAPVAAIAVLLACWLTVGLFIVAHDAMHGSLAPGHKRLNALLGRLCVTLYAGFDYDKLLVSHHAHHRLPGTDDDPDFDPHRPHAALSWYATFMRRYLSVRPLLFFAVVTNVEVHLLGAAYWRVIVFWAVPAVLSSFQLFYFGTYQPHRDGTEAFADRHRTRTSDFGWFTSLVTCFHFGYHHEHHLEPWVPWWRLPAAHATVTRSSP